MTTSRTSTVKQSAPEAPVREPTRAPRMSAPAQPAPLSGNLSVAAGNLAMQRLLRAEASPPKSRGVRQTKLAINEPGDSCEQDADRVADQVMRTPEPRLQRAWPRGGGSPTGHTAQPDRDHGSVQTTRVQASDTGQVAAPPIVHEVLRSPGQPLDPATRAFMEPRFGRDFSDVRVHTGSVAEESARNLRARAYTAGRNIVFGAGRLVPETFEGRRLIAHELTHVTQQTVGAPGSQMTGLVMRSPDDDLTQSPNLKFVPEEVHLPDATVGTTASALCRVENLEDQPIVLEDLDSDNPAFKIDVKSNSIPAEGQLPFGIAFTPRAVGRAETLVTASLRIGPVAYLHVEGTGLPAKSDPAAGPQPGDPRYQPPNPLALPVPLLGDPRYVPVVYGPFTEGLLFGPGKPATAKPADTEPSPPVKPVAQPQLKPLVVNPASVEFTSTPNHDPIEKTIRLENPNDVEAQVNLSMDGTAESAAFFVGGSSWVIGPRQVLDPATSVFFLPEGLGTFETTVRLSQTAASHAPHVQTIRFRGVTKKAEPPATGLAVPDLSSFDAKNWTQARAQLRRARIALDSVDREYELWVPNQKKAADEFTARYVNAVTNFQASLLALLTEDTVNRLRQLRPHNLQHIVAFLLDFPLAFAPHIVGIAKEAVFLISFILENRETNRKIDESIAKAEINGATVSKAITNLTTKAVGEMRVGSKAMAQADGAWKEMATGEKKMFVDQEQELEKSSGGAHNMQRAKEVYQTGAALMTRFRSAEVELAESLRYIAERSIRIDGELEKAYHEIELLVKGPGPAVDRASGTLEITVTPKGPTAEEIRRQLEAREVAVTSIEVKPWQATGFYDRRRNMVFVITAEGTKNLTAIGLVRSATKSLQTREGVVMFKVSYY